MQMARVFSIYLRGEEVQHDNLVDNLVYTEGLTYRLYYGTDDVTEERDVSD